MLLMHDRYEKLDSESILLRTSILMILPPKDNVGVQLLKSSPYLQILAVL